tara:strand:+ start:399 stop:1394 length:996 start_codon:yes stop_codon:yes gene_type:complete
MSASGVGSYLNPGARTGTEITQLPEALLEVFSLDILHQAQAVMRFEEFAVRKQELERAPGEVVKFTIYDDITRGGKLYEDDILSAKTMSADQKTITVSEWGNAIQVSEKLLRLSWDDVMGEAATLLGRDFAVVRDLALRDAIFETTNNIFVNEKADRFALRAGDTLDIDAIRDAVELLQTNNAPKFFGDYYVCFLHPHQAAQLKRDPDWVNAHQYVGTRNIFTGEIGRFEDVIFIISTHMPNGAVSSGHPAFDANLTTSNLEQNGVDPADSEPLYKAVVFGDQCLYIADSLPVELRDNGVEDFGRKHGLAWYSIFGVKNLLPEYSVAITSA